jgi:hypothetical protein
VLKREKIKLKIKDFIQEIPLIGDLSGLAKRKLFSQAPPSDSEQFSSSKAYWENRYAAGGDSGPGSHRKLARFKADILNAFVISEDIESIIEFGCGDGRQLKLFSFPKYLGLDVSPTAISRCRKLFRLDDSKTFKLSKEYSGEKAELTLSLDVIFHLVEDDIFEEYMRRLFASSNRYVVIYSSDTDENTSEQGPHVKHRKFTEWIENNLINWRLIRHIPNKYPYKGDVKKGSSADFYIYKKLKMAL